MRKLIVVSVVAFAALSVFTGCASVTMTAEENQNRAKQIDDLAIRQMADDWNMIWFYDRQPRASRWHVR